MLPYIGLWNVGSLKLWSMTPIDHLLWSVLCLMREQILKQGQTDGNNDREEAHFEYINRGWSIFLLGVAWTLSKHLAHQHTSYGWSCTGHSRWYMVSLWPRAHSQSFKWPLKPRPVRYVSNYPLTDIVYTTCSICCNITTSTKQLSPIHSSSIQDLSHFTTAPRPLARVSAPGTAIYHPRLRHFGGFERLSRPDEKLSSARGYNHGCLR